MSQKEGPSGFSGAPAPAPVVSKSAWHKGPPGQHTPEPNPAKSATAGSPAPATVKNAWQTGPPVICTPASSGEGDLAAVEKLFDSCHNRMHLQGKSFADLFDACDTDPSRDLSMDDIEVIFRDAGVPMQGDNLRRIFDHLRRGRSGGVGQEQLRQALKLHAEQRELADLLRQHTDFAWLIARSVLRSPTDTIASLRKLETSVLRERISALEPAFLDAVVHVYEVVEKEEKGKSELPHHLLPRLHRTSVAAFAQDKFAAFAQDTDGLIQAQFGDINLFMHMGLVGLIGRPSPDIFRAMEAEHDSDRKFKPGNYPGERTPREEFEFVFKPVEGKLYPHEIVGAKTEGRERKLLEDLMLLPDIVASKATLEEVLALRLFTGAMYSEYNWDLRNALTYYLKDKAKKIVANFDRCPDDVKLVDLRNVAASLGLDKTKPSLQEEEMKKALVAALRKVVADLPSERPRCLYVTTIHMANSCIIKLAAVMHCPKDRKVYRGFSGINLPFFFYSANKLGFRGGVEVAIMSTTTRKSVALTYSSHGHMPIVLELEVGQVNCGADVRLISQYGGEDEVTFPPLTHIDILECSRIEEVDGKQVFVMSGKISVNIKSLNREQLVSQRKDNLLASLSHQVFQIERVINHKLDAFVQEREATRRSLGLTETDALSNSGRQVVRKVVEECERTVQRYRDLEPEAFNSDEHLHHLALQEVADLPTAAAAKFSYFCQDQRVNTANFNLMSMEQWAALRVTEMWHAYQTEVAREHVDKERLRKAAVGLAEARGLVSMDKGGLDAISGSDASTALIRAVASTHEHDVRLLLDASCSIDAADAKGHTALAQCMMFGRDDMARELLSRGASLQTRSHRGETLFFLASRFGNSGLLRTLLAQEDARDLLFVKPTDPPHGSTCLLIAAYYGHFATVELLVREGGRALLFLTNGKGVSCLHHAALQGHLAVVELLVKEGGMQLIFLKNKRGGSPLHFAAQGGDSQVVQLLIDMLVKEGSSKLLLDTDDNGWSCLHMAAQNGHLSVVELMVKQGGKELLLLQEKGGWSCLHMAAKSGHLSVVEVLVKDGGLDLLLLTNRRGESCLYIAAQNGHSAVEEVLVKACKEYGLSAPEVDMLSRIQHRPFRGGEGGRRRVSMMSGNGGSASSGRDGGARPSTVTGNAVATAVAPAVLAAVRLRRGGRGGGTGNGGGLSRH